MHANVGGGYERSGVSSVPLYWMMLRTQHHGLVFKASAMQRAFSASHVHGTMYDSRAGLSMIYRYHPRDIEARCENRMLDGRIKIHHSVTERLNYRTENYKPNHIPMDFDIVDNAIPANRERVDLCDSTVRLKKIMYDLMMTYLFTVIIYVGYFWQSSSDNVNNEGIWMSFAVKLDSYLSDMFKGLFGFIIVQNTAVFIVAPIFLILFALTLILNKTTESASEALRHEIIEKNIKDIKQVYKD